MAKNSWPCAYERVFAEFTRGLCNVEEAFLVDDVQSNSITEWFHALRENDQEATERLWDRLFDDLLAVAKRKLGDAPRRFADEEDVVVSVFDTLFRGAAEGRFADLADRQELWRLMVTITAQKAVDQVRHQCRQKRGGGEVRGDSVFSQARDDGVAGFDQFLDSQPTAPFLAILEDEHRRLLELLRDETVRDVARLRLGGYTNAEVSDQLGMSLRSVERKLRLIRDTWIEELEP